MGHNRTSVSYLEHLEKENGKLYRYILANYKGLEMDVLKQEIGTGDIYLRNMDFYGASGWLFYSPDEKLRYSNSKRGVDQWWLCKSTCTFTGDSIINTKQQIIEMFSDSEFRYIIEALEFNNFYMINNFYIAWLKNHRIEGLIKKGYYSLALDKRLAKCSPELERKIVQTINKEKPPLYVSYKDLMCMIKHNCSYWFVQFGGDTKLPDYLVKQNERYVYYCDYIKLAKMLKKDLKNDYWKYPKNLVEAHNSLMEEKQKIENLKNKKERDALSKKIKNRFIKNSASINYLDLVVSLPQDLADIENQASCLKQCLITNDYHVRHANKEITLVFIKKGNDPIATAEIKKDGSLGQFYADEADRKNCQPTPKVKNAFNKWYKQFYERTTQNG